MGYPAQAGMGSWFDDAIAAVRNVYVNTRYGVLTEQQKGQIIEQESQDLVKASGGQMGIEEARQIARGDATAVLTGRQADPSQQSFWNMAAFDSELFPNLSAVLKWGAVGLGALLVILIVKD